MRAERKQLSVTEWDLLAGKEEDLTAACHALAEVPDSILIDPIAFGNSLDEASDVQSGFDRMPFLSERRRRIFVRRKGI